MKLAIYIGKREVECAQRLAALRAELEAGGCECYVLEEGQLRAIGASKKDIARVFNAETLFVGFVAGMIGIVCSLGLIVIINIILYHFTGVANLQAILEPTPAVILVVISMGLTFVAGLFPSKTASKKDPVIALRTE